MFIGSAKRNDLNIMNTFFDCKTSNKLTWKSLNGETKN